MDTINYVFLQKFQVATSKGLDNFITQIASLESWFPTLLLIAGNGIIFIWVVFCLRREKTQTRLNTRKNRCKIMISGIGLVFLGLLSGNLFGELQDYRDMQVERQVPMENLAYDMATALLINVKAVQGRENIQIVAHRGYSYVYPENTIASFEGALDIGVDYIETDVQMTKDGQIVIFHDEKLKRTAKRKGKISDYTYEELQEMDVGKWFSADFAGTKIPTLQETLTCIKDSDVKLCIELKDIGDVEGFEESVLQIVQDYGMTDRCVFASFCYPYLEHIKELDSSVQTLYFTTSTKITVTEEFPAEYYGMNIGSMSAGQVDAVHDSGAKVFAWTADSPITIANAQALGVDGIITNRPGLAKVIPQPKYSFLEEHYQKSLTMPGLYEPTLLDACRDMVPQGVTRAGENLVVSAYSASGEYNSILYVMDLQGGLQKVVDLKFQAHVGGIAYDELHDLLWVAGPQGMVYGLSWSTIVDDTYNGEIQVSFDAGLLNENQAKVTSFLTLDRGMLYVGSYVDGANGRLKCYDLTEPSKPLLLNELVIPERIQGITFQENRLSGLRYMILSQGYQTEDSQLLRFVYNERDKVYDVPQESWTLPEGVEQIQMTASGLYVLFDSSARSYRDKTGLVNDQIYVLRM